MSFELFGQNVGAYCPACGKRLKPIAIKGEDGTWYKAWGCGCVVTDEEVQKWEAEIAMLRNPKATA